jgi:hypothetical protein
MPQWAVKCVFRRVEAIGREASQQSPLMDDLTARLAKIFRRYQIDFGRMGQMSETEIEQAIQPFLIEVGALIDEHGREAVLRAAVLLPTGLPILH